MTNEKAIIITRRGNQISFTHCGVLMIREIPEAFASHWQDWAIDLFPAAVQHLIRFSGQESVRVTTRFDEVIESTRVIDYNNNADRVWLRNHLHWALCNQRNVSLTQTAGKPTLYERLNQAHRADTVI